RDPASACPAPNPAKRLETQGLVGFFIEHPGPARHAPGAPAVRHSGQGRDPASACPAPNPAKRLETQGLVGFFIEHPGPAR
ncbi:hypothetical protein Q2T49_34360, partial [Pseudomonas aeruginosa]|uniref:hypothetical protein n=1 Tax=Pseudomonas aeruginosa TaxID=287 RepID=UPI00265E74CE